MAPEPGYEAVAQLPVYAQPWEPPGLPDGNPLLPLLRASSRAATAIGEARWDTTQNAELLHFDGDVATWRRPAAVPEQYPPAWVPASTLAQLHSGTFRWDFEVEHMQSAQLGLGFMLVFEDGVDWGLYGYLGAARTAWSYDPSTGDVVNATESIAGGLPTFEDGESGTVTVELELPRDAPGRGRFIVNGQASPDIELPAGAVIMPAACFLREGQQVRFGEVVRVR